MAPSVQGIDFSQLAGVQLCQEVRAGKHQASDLARYYWQRSNTLAPKVNSHTYLHDAEALAQAFAQAIADARQQPLCGLPVLVKDNLAVAGMPMSCASAMLEGYRPPYEATVISRLRQAGAVVLGKTNLDEFSMGSTTETSVFGPVLNPWHAERVAGGSSGGAAAAVALDLASVAIGSDTGGSIRQPASFCGVSGFKPSYGRLSRFGLTAYASSLDHVGPMARRVEDLCLVYDVMAGFDPLDATSLPSASGASALRSVSAQLGEGAAIWRGRRVGVLQAPPALRQAQVAPGVQRCIDEALQVLVGLGAELVPLSVPSLSFAVATYYIIAMAEASANLARYDGVRYGLRVKGDDASLRSMYQATRRQGFGKEVQRRILMGTFILSAGYSAQYYEKALAARARIKADLVKALEGVDILVGPTAPTTALPLAPQRGKTGAGAAEDPLTPYLNDFCTTPANLAGLPSLSLPCGFDDMGLPVGLQLVGPALGDERVLRLGHGYQQASSWHLQRCGLAQSFAPLAQGGV